MTRAQKVTYEYGASIERANRLEEQATSQRTKYERSLIDLNKMFDQGLISLQAYNKELDRMNGGSFGDRMASGVHAFAGASTRAIGAVRDASSLMRGEFNTAGEALGKIGGMATLIPGPWGQAIGSVITVVGQLADLINRDLVKAQQAAKAEFMAIAQGAKNVGQAMRSIDTHVIHEGIERSVRNLQNLEQLRNSGIGVGAMLATGNAQTVMNMLDPQAAAQASSRDVMQWMRRQMEMRRESLRMLLTDPQMIQMRQELAVQEIGGGLLDRPIQLEEHAARRRMMRQMHSPSTGGAEQQALAERQLANANARLAVMQLIRRTQDENGQATLTEAEAEGMLFRQIRVSNAALIEDMRRRRDERMEEHSTQATQKWREEIEKLQDSWAVLMVKRAGGDEFMTKRLEEAMKTQRELQKLQDQGASAPQLFIRGAELEAAANQRLRNQELQAGVHMLQANISPSEKYADGLQRAGYLLQQNAISQRTYNEEVIRLRHAYEAANPYLAELNQQMQRGQSIIEGYRDPYDKLEDKIYDVTVAYERGIATTEEYENALARLRREQEALNGAFDKAPSILAGSAAGFRLAREQAIRFSPRDVTENPYAGLPSQIYGDNSGIAASQNPNLNPLGPGVGGAGAVAQHFARQMQEALQTALFGRQQTPAEIADDVGEQVMDAIRNATGFGRGGGAADQQADLVEGQRAGNGILAQIRDILQGGDVGVEDGIQGRVVEADL